MVNMHSVSFLGIWAERQFRAWPAQNYVVKNADSSSTVNVIIVGGYFVWHIAVLVNNGVPPCLFVGIFCFMHVIPRGCPPPIDVEYVHKVCWDIVSFGSTDSLLFLKVNIAIVYNFNLLLLTEVDFPALTFRGIVWMVHTRTMDIYNAT